jgi:hypothetical protein
MPSILLDGEKPNIRLNNGKEGILNIEDYIDVPTEWQGVVIPLAHFGTLDFALIQTLEVVIEWEDTDVRGMFFLFLPKVGCSQAAPRNLTFLPLVARGYEPPPPLDPIWDFESGTEGWTTYKTYTPSLALIAAERSSYRSRWGSGSLAMVADLVGGHESLSKGAAYVDLTQTTDLACKPLTCWVYVPTCGLGDPATPNYVRLFVRDQNENLEYAARTPVVRNQWFEIHLRPSTLAPEGGSIILKEGQGAFDPHAITRVGVQFGTEKAGVTYRGKIYLDACGWQDIDPASAAGAGACLPDSGRTP